MRIEHKSKKRWPLVITIATIVIIICAGIGVYATQKFKPNDTKENTTTSSSTDTNLDPPTNEEIQTGKDIKEQKVNPSTPVQTTESLNITANNTDSNIQVRATIASSIQDGTCTITLTKGSSTVTKPSVGIQPLSGYSTCKGWDIPLSELSSGTWNIEIVAKYQSKVASGKTEVTIP